MVGLGRLELPTSRLSGVRSNRLSYRPDAFAFASCLKKEKRRRRTSRAEASTSKIQRVFQHTAEFCFTVTGEGRNSYLYDLVPIDRFVFGACLLAVGTATSDAPIFRGLTGGVYKAQEHIHRGMLTRDY